MRKHFVIIALCLSSLPLLACSRKSGQASVNDNSSNQSATTKEFADVPAELRNPQDSAGYYALGVALYKNDHDREAVEAFKKSVELDPQNADAYRRLGLAYLATGQRKEAEESYKKAIELFEKRVREDAKDADALYNLADSYGKVSEYDKAAEAYRRAIKLKEPDGSTYYDIGLVYNKLARYDDAAKAFAKAVELDPNDYQSQEALDKAHEDASKLRERIDYQKKLLEKQRAQNQNNSNAASNQNGARPKAKTDKQ
jgi:tetratricopeptide (TPR) repeat protein